MTIQQPTQDVVDHFESIDGCTVASASNGRVELTLDCMDNTPNALPGGRKSADVIAEAWGYQYTVEHIDEDTCVVTGGRTHEE